MTVFAAPILNPSFDAVGAGAGSASAPASLTETHIIAGNFVLAAVISSPTFELATCTCGGVAMTSLGSSYFNGNPANGGNQLFYLSYPPTGSQSIVASFATQPTFAILNSISCVNVHTVGALQFNWGTGTAFSQTVTSTANGIIIQAFGTAFPSSASSLPTLTGYTQTSEYNKTVGAKVTGGAEMVLGYAAGSASVSFAATESTSLPWVGTAVSLK